jgi:hypothetical protein
MVKSRIRKNRKYRKSRKYRGGDLTAYEKTMINTRFPGPPSPVPTFFDVGTFINVNRIQGDEKRREIVQYISNRYGVERLSYRTAPLTPPPLSRSDPTYPAGIEL